ncbi:MAG: ClbS/DfsB family four-helix bundle protein [Crocinitomix sp.]|nr:ClbS/DfsB family four-helix bundle protein [Crocinitomix sp.]
MPRPKTKEELLAQSKKNYQRLLDLIASYSKEALDKDFVNCNMNRNVRDCITHLHEWHLMVLDWYRIGNTGEKPKIPAEGYTWKTLPDLNKKIWEQYQETDLETALKLFETSYQKIRSLIENHSDNDLFEKKKYNWTGSTSLAAYLISCSVAHHDWAYKRIKKSLKKVKV